MSVGTTSQPRYGRPSEAGMGVGGGEGKRKVDDGGEGGEGVGPWVDQLREGVESGSGT